MLGRLTLLATGLLLAIGGAAVAAPAPHFAAPVERARGSTSRAPSISQGSRGAPRPAPLSRGGTGTLGQYYGRTPSARQSPGSYPYYLAPYYNGFLFSPFYNDPFFDDGFYSDYWGQPYPPDYYSREGWSKRGNVELHVDPKDVEVIVDGIPTANSGRAVLDLPSGPHHIEIRRAGYQPWVLELDVKQGVRYRLDQRLERLPTTEEQGDANRPPGTQWGAVRLNVQPEDAIVGIDGRLLGMASLLHGSQALRHIPLGRHTLRFTRPGYRPVERQIDVTADRPAEVTLELQRG